MSEIKINISFRNLSGKKDSKKRSEHVFERMRLRGISTNNIRDAVKMGAKRIRADGAIISEFRWFKVVYRKCDAENIKKIYPITVIEV